MIFDARFSSPTPWFDNKTFDVEFLVEEVAQGEG